MLMLRHIASGDFDRDGLGDVAVWASMGSGGPSQEYGTKLFILTRREPGRPARDHRRALSFDRSSEMLERDRPHGRLLSARRRQVPDAGPMCPTDDDRMTIVDDCVVEPSQEPC